MTTPTPVSQAKIPEIIRNDAGLYQGDLIHYFRIVFGAQNVGHPYHNFRHMLHVFWHCYDACGYYRSQMTPRQMRNLLVAALFHDFNHSGLMGEDDLNIERAVRGLRRYLAPEDEPELGEIAVIIRATQYPYEIETTELPLPLQIIRDADLCQALDVAWIQQVVFGLAAEWRKTPLEVLKGQAGFLRGVHYATDWAQDRFPKSRIAAKIAEAHELLELLETAA